MRLLVTLFVISAAAIIGFWAWLGAAVPMPDSPVGQGEKLYCVSYAPFRGSQSPLDPATHIDPAQIEDDIVRLSKLTDCVRTYSVDAGLERIPEIAARHGMIVLLGLWLSGHPDKNRVQIATAIGLANEYRNTVRAVVVGNEVLLRGEMSAENLAVTIRAVKARVPVPVTYADVWEFWLRNRALADAVDFITIHILPYWEDDPIPASAAAAHVDSIRRRVAEAFPGKEIMIGEFGWPSAGRMREGALPSPVNQARVIQELLALGKRENFRVNLIEAFDQPWKRALEGTVGGHWGLFDDASRDFKFAWGAPVSNHPQWSWQAAAGVIFAALIFFAAASRGASISLLSAFIVGVIAFVGGSMIGWAAENVPLESNGIGGWIRSLALLAVALLTPVVAAHAVTERTSLPAFSEPLAGGKPVPLIRSALSIVLIGTTILAVMIALGLSFDPRYRDFPFAPLSAAVVPLLLVSVAAPAGKGPRGVAELLSTGVLLLCAAFIEVNETFANWQSLWLCAILLALAFTLTRVRAAQS
jgi:glucan 1,3-beta-glucosidase